MIFSANGQQGAQYDGLGEKVNKEVGSTILQAFFFQVNTRLYYWEEKP